MKFLNGKLNFTCFFQEIKPILLETIFENDEEHEETESPSCKVGSKTKRIIKVCDGLNITKALKEKRKNLIKKHLGSKKKTKKMALAKFMEYFNEKTAESPEVSKT